MAESGLHRQLVKTLADSIVRMYLGGDDGPVFVDDGSPSRRPPQIGGYVPDVYVPPMGTRGIIIGEAETSRSLERPDTLLQIRAFMSACGILDGSILVLAVPWDRARLAMSILRQIKTGGCGQHVQTQIVEKIIL